MEFNHTITPIQEQGKYGTVPAIAISPVRHKICDIGVWMISKWFVQENEFGFMMG